MLTFFLFIIGIIALILWSGVLFTFGYVVGLLTAKKEEDEFAERELHMDIQQAMDDPIFSKFINDKPFVKVLLARNALSDVWYDNNAVQIGINNPADYDDIVYQAIQTANQATFTYIANKSKQDR